MREEKDIIRGCIQGERWAQEALYNLHGKSMWAVCIRYAGNTQDASDLLQEGFIKVFDKIGSFKGESPLGGWMARIFINLAITKFRAAARAPRQISIDQHGLDMEDAEDDVELGLYKLDDVLKAMNQLPEIYKLTLNLYAVDNLSHQQIAEQLGTSVGNSKSNLSRARKMLKDLLEKQKPKG